MDISQNYFEIFGLPVDFRVDVADLSDRYVELQRVVHPDRFASGSDAEKRQSMQETTFLNTAHDTLKSPLKRAIYMLKLEDVTIEHNPQLPPAFLMEQIELRETLESIEDDTSLERLDAFKAEVGETMRTIEADFAASIGSDNDAAETAVYELQFLNKLLLEARQLEEKLLDY